MYALDLSYYPNWQKRYVALKERIEELAQYLKNNNGVARVNELAKVVECLHLYVAGNFEFYIDGFGKQAYNQLISSDNYSVDHIFRSLINQPFEDILIIEHIARQRIQAPAGNREANILQTADTLAWDALQPALAAGLLPDCNTVITYFQKTGSIRIIPYAPIALIGIPYTVQRDYRDFLAIPHEIGHYVYRRAGWLSHDTYRSLRELITYHVELENRDPVNKRPLPTPTIPNYIQEWIEEIFADYYGCCIAGASIAVDFQDLQKQFSDKAFRQHDNEHPAPILRPRIYNKVLYERSLNSARILESRWQALEGNGFFYSDSNTQVAIDNVISRGKGQSSNRPIEKILSIIIDRLAQSVLSWSEARWWTITREYPLPGNTNKDNIDSKLYEAFNVRFKENGELNDDSNIEDSQRRWPKSTVPSLIDCQLVCDLSILENALKDPTLRNWPALFFPNNDYPYAHRPVQQGKRLEDEFKENKDLYWWVWDVLFRAGWNTFGNGDWLKGP